MNQTQEQIEHLRTIRETSSFWADVAENQLPALADKIDNIDLTPIENKVDKGVSTLSAKIDNIDLSSVAKQGENQEATNSAIYNSIGYAIEKLEDMAGDGGGGSVESIAAELVAGKKLIAAAITEKGVETSPTDSMMQMAENVGSIITTEGYVFPSQSMQDSITEINTEIKKVDLSWLVNEDGYVVMRNLKRIVINNHSKPFFTRNIGYFFPNLETIVLRQDSQRAGLFFQHGNLIFPKLTQIQVNRGFGIICGGGTLEGIVDLSALTEISSSLSIYRTDTESTTMMMTKVILGSVVKGETIYILDNISYPTPTHDTSRLTDVEVMEGFAVNLDLGRCNHITRENIVEHIFKRLATVTATRTVSIDATPFALLTDEDIAIATNKGWTIKSI